MKSLYLWLLARGSMGRNLSTIVPVGIVAACSFAAHGQQGEAKKASPPASPQVISGDVISAEESGTVLILTTQWQCSGTLLTNEWAITAQHCDLDIAHPANVTVIMGTQSTVGVFAVGHPSLDFALVRLQHPMMMGGSATGFRRALYSGSGASLEGQTLTCRGYGCNAYTPGDPDIEHCTGNDGTLREALLQAKPGGTDDYNFTVTKNSKGQSLAPVFWRRLLYRHVNGFRTGGHQPRRVHE